MTVWKYLLHLVSKQFIDIPKGAKPVHFATQGNQICLWVEVDPNAEKEQREIRCEPTGGNMPDDGKSHLGTVVLSSQTVWHYYW